MRNGERSPVEAVLAVLAAVVVATAAAGCRDAWPGERIDVPALERELEAVVALRLDGQGLPGRSVEATCTGAGDDGLRFLCYVEIRSPGDRLLEENVAVTCLPEREPGRPRCATDAGDALQ